MERLLVVSYPIVDVDRLAWIQDIRSQYDELNFKTIEPHFTFVFPVAGIDRETFIRHVQRSLANRQSFEFVIRCATICDDAFSDYTHVFLVPDEGYSQIVKLHDRLYTGILAAKLHLDLPFIPHIGIANSRNAIGCKQLADRLNQQQFEIRGTVTKLDILWDKNDRVETIEEVLLG
jgi:hypothetical protein